MAPPCGGDARKDQSLKTPTPKAKLPRSDSMPTGTKVDKKTESKRLREEGEAILDRLEPQLKRRGHLQDDDKSKSPSDAKVEKSRQQGKATAVKAKAAPNPKSRQADDGDDANKTKQAAGSRNAKSQASNGTEKQSQESELQPKVANNTPRKLSKPKTACKQAKKSESSSDDDDDAAARKQPPPSTASAKQQPKKDEQSELSKDVHAALNRQNTTSDTGSASKNTASDTHSASKSKSKTSQAPPGSPPPPDTDDESSDEEDGEEREKRIALELAKKDARARYMRFYRSLRSTLPLKWVREIYTFFTNGQLKPNRVLTCSEEIIRFASACLGCIGLLQTQSDSNSLVHLPVQSIKCQVGYDATRLFHLTPVSLSHALA